jgi:hypothetical protein
MIAFIDDHRGAHGVEPICKVLPIAPSTYHSHVAKRRDPARLSARARQDAALKIEVRRVFDQNFGVYGVRKVYQRPADVPHAGIEVRHCPVPDSHQGVVLVDQLIVLNPERFPGPAIVVDQLHAEGLAIALQRGAVVLFILAEPPNQVRLFVPLVTKLSDLPVALPQLLAKRVEIIVLVIEVLPYFKRHDHLVRHIRGHFS